MLPSGQIAIPQKKKDGMSGDEIALIAATGLLGVGVGAGGVYAFAKRGTGVRTVPVREEPKNAAAFTDEAETRSRLDYFPMCIQKPGDNRCGYYAALTMTQGRALLGDRWDGSLNRYAGMVEQYRQHFPFANRENLSDWEKRELRKGESLRTSEIGLLHNAMRSEIDSAKAAAKIYFVPMGANAYECPATGEKIALDVDDIVHRFKSKEQLKEVLNGDRRTIRERLMFNDRAFLVGDSNVVVPSFTVSTMRAAVQPGKDVTARPAAPSGSVEQRELPPNKDQFILNDPANFSASGGGVTFGNTEIYHFPTDEGVTPKHGHAITIAYHDNAWWAHDPLRYGAGPIELARGEQTAQSARDAIYNLMFGNGGRFADLHLGKDDVVQMSLVTPRLTECPKIVENTLQTLPPTHPQVAPNHFLVRK